MANSWQPQQNRSFRYSSSTNSRRDTGAVRDTTNAGAYGGFSDDVDEDSYGDPFEYHEPTDTSYEFFATGYTAGYSGTEASPYSRASTGARYASGQRSRPPQKKKSSGLLVAAIMLLVVGLVLLGIAIYFLWHTMAEYEVGNSEYSQLVEEVIIEDEVSGDITVDFSALVAQNSEIVGWIRIPGTIINYPVVQHADNDWYLEHTFLGVYNLAGAIFMDYRSDSALNDRVTVIYGHHLKNGSMFAKVADYSSQAEFDTLEDVYYVTSDGVIHTLKPLCTLVVSGYNVEILQFNFANDALFQSYVDSLISRSSAHAADASSQGVSHLYILSTCSYNTDNERTMLICTEVSASNVADKDAIEDVVGIQEAANEAAGA